MEGRCREGRERGYRACLGSGVGRSRAKVFIVGRCRSALDAAVTPTPQSLVAIQGDTSKSKDLKHVFDVVRTSEGKIDVLVIHAGVQSKHLLGAITEQALDYQIAVNFKRVIFTMQEALSLLVYGASVVLLSSTIDAEGLPARTVYSATKAAVRSFARTWANELNLLKFVSTR